MVTQQQRKGSIIICCPGGNPTPPPTKNFFVTCAVGGGSYTFLGASSNQSLETPPLPLSGMRGITNLWRQGQGGRLTAIPFNGRRVTTLIAGSHIFTLQEGPLFKALIHNQSSFDLIPRDIFLTVFASHHKNSPEAEICLSRNSFKDPASSVIHLPVVKHKTRRTQTRYLTAIRSRKSINSIRQPSSLKGMLTLLYLSKLHEYLWNGDIGINIQSTNCADIPPLMDRIQVKKENNRRINHSQSRIVYGWSPSV
ncbi:hypothetical protein CEXT_488641 [Caerostris extrusa]|uniref:Uncharacterized protein n=1 Tax=Caerostris extrusa TaxID=172846 RepID=A0AAV4NRZ8_CAEEX|nr:hypothetical protein CEXT_488641 [Caerostris extrusa]